MASRQLTARFHVALTLNRVPSNFYCTTSQRDDDAPNFNMANPFEKEKVRCVLCQHNVTPDYKNVKLLSQFQSPYTGRIYGKHITGLCTHKQNQVEAEIRKSQSAGLMATYFKDPYFLSDAKLFDPDKPLKPHRF